MKHNKTFSLKTLMGLVIATFIHSSYAFANEEKGNAENGKELYENSKCQKCHSSEVYTRKDRKVTSIPALEKKVRMCDSQFSVNWFNEDISDVVAYLNKAFYKFEDKKAKAKKSSK